MQASYFAPRARRWDRPLPACFRVLVIELALVAERARPVCKPLKANFCFVFVLFNGVLCGWLRRWLHRWRRGCWLRARCSGCLASLFDVV